MPAERIGFARHLKSQGLNFPPALSCAIFAVLLAGCPNLETPDLEPRTGGSVDR